MVGSPRPVAQVSAVTEEDFFLIIYVDEIRLLNGICP